MKKNDITNSGKIQEILQEYNQNLEQEKPEPKEEINGLKENSDKTRVYVDLLRVEKAIKNNGITLSIGNDIPSSWQSLVANIIFYDQYHDYKNEKTFGKQYLEAALKYYDAVYDYYTLEKKDYNSNHSEMRQSLDELLISIREEIATCDQKLKNNKI